MAEQERVAIAAKTTAAIGAMLPLLIAVAARVSRGMKERKRQQNATSTLRTKGKKPATSLTDGLSGLETAVYEIETILSVQCETGYSEAREKLDV